MTRLREPPAGPLPGRCLPHIAEIQAETCRHYRLTPAAMVSGARVRRVARPRQIAMALARQLTRHSLPEIGRHFGGRDHSTVLHAVRAIDTLGDQDEELAHDVQQICLRLARRVADRLVGQEG